MNPTDQMPCRNGCVLPGTEGNDEPTMMPARQGSYCARCYSRAQFPLNLAPSLAEHVASMRTAHGATDEARVSSGSPFAPLPFNEQAFGDVNAIYEMLVYFTRYFATRLRLPAPEPAMHAWRNMSGHVKGLPANVTPEAARHQTSVMAAWLLSHLPAIYELDDADDIEGFTDSLRQVYFVSARWPMKARPYYSDMPHHCGGRIAIYPPKEFANDPVTVCEGCGRTWSPAAFTADFEEWTAEQIVERRQQRVARFLARKHTPAGTLAATKPAGIASSLRRRQEEDRIREALAEASEEVPPAGVLVTHDDGVLSIAITHQVPAGTVQHRHQVAGGLLATPAAPIGAR